MKYKCYLFIIFLISIIFFNCSSSNINNNSGGKVNKPVIISLPNAATEIICLLGMADNIVAISSNCDYPPEIMDRQRIGRAFGSVNIEAVLSLKPDIIFCSQSHASLFEKFGIKTFVVSTSNFNEVSELIINIGKKLDKETEARVITENMQNRIDKILQQQKEFSTKPKVYFESGRVPGKSRGKGSLTHDLIELAGGINIAGYADGSFPVLSNEFIIKKNPDLIILEEYGFSIDEVKQRPGWEKINAVKNNKIYRSPVYFTNYTPRCIEAIETFYQYFYTE